jgi:hypothetical protein
MLQVQLLERAGVEAGVSAAERFTKACLGSSSSAFSASGVTPGGPKPLLLLMQTCPCTHAALAAGGFGLEGLRQTWCHLHVITYSHTTRYKVDVTGTRQLQEGVCNGRGAGFGV